MQTQSCGGMGGVGGGGGVGVGWVLWGIGHAIGLAIGGIVSRLLLT